MLYRSGLEPWALGTLQIRSELSSIWVCHISPACLTLLMLCLARDPKQENEIVQGPEAFSFDSEQGQSLNAAPEPGTAAGAETLNT